MQLGVVTSFVGKSAVTLLLLWGAWQVRSLDISLDFLNVSRKPARAAILPDGDAEGISPDGNRNHASGSERSVLERLRLPPGDSIGDGPGRMRMGDLEWHWVTVESRRFRDASLDELTRLLAAQGWSREYDGQYWEALASADPSFQQPDQILFRRFKQILVVTPGRPTETATDYRVVWINRPSLQAVHEEMGRIAGSLAHGDVSIHTSTPDTGAGSLQLSQNVNDAPIQQTRLVQEEAQQGWSLVDGGGNEGDGVRSAILAKDGYLGIVVTDEMSGRSVRWREGE